jgi:hypothetical protein
MGTESPETHAVFYCLATDKWCCPTGSFDTDMIVNTTCCGRPELVFEAKDPVVWTVADIQIVSTMSRADVRVAATATTSTVRNSMVGSAATQVAATSGSAVTESLVQERDSRIGVYVGVPLGLVLAIVLAVVAWLIVQNRKLRKTAMGGPYATDEPAGTGQMRYAQSRVYELGTRPEELPDGDYLRAELESEKY